MWAKNEGVLGASQPEGHVCEVVCLNRIFRWCDATAHTKEAIGIEADERHAAIIIAQLHLKPESNGVVTPGIRATSADVGEPLPPNDLSKFRYIVMRASHLAEDRPDIRYAAKEAARCMSEPTTVVWLRLKRIGRYLVRVPRLVSRLEPQPPCHFSLAYSDSDHAGCLRTRGATGTL